MGMEDYNVIGDPDLAPDVPAESGDASDVGYDNTSSGLSSTNVQDAIDEVVARDLLSLLHPVGTIIESTTCDTMAKVVEKYGGTTWISHSGYMLRGATSGVTNNDATSSGGADSVALVEKNIPNHTHSTPDHTHTLTMDNGGSWSFENRALFNRTGSTYNVTAGTNTTTSATDTSNYKISNNSYTTALTGTNKVSHSGHKHTLNWTSSGGGTSGSYGSTGGQSNVNTLPKYKSVYIWERTA